MKALLSPKAETALKKGGSVMMDSITQAGFILAIFMAGVSVGKFVEKVERLIRDKENEKHTCTHKNDRR